MLFASAHCYWHLASQKDVFPRLLASRARIRTRYRARPGPPVVRLRSAPARQPPLPGAAGARMSRWNSQHVYLVSLTLALRMRRYYDFVISLSRMTSMLVDASPCLVERLVAAESAARAAPNNVVGPGLAAPRFCFHCIWCRSSCIQGDRGGPCVGRRHRPPRESSGSCFQVGKKAVIIYKLP